MKRDLVENIEIIAKRVPDENVVKIHHPERLVLQIRIAAGGNENLAEGKRNTLAQLIAAADGRASEGGRAIVAVDEIVHRIEAVRGLGAGTIEIRVNLFGVGAMESWRDIGDLVVQPCSETKLLNAVEFGWSHTERGLFK